MNLKFILSHTDLAGGSHPCDYKSKEVALNWVSREVYKGKTHKFGTSH